MRGVGDSDEGSERHASWLELFFDLVVVAAVAQLAGRMHEAPSLWGVGAFAMLYYAVWSVWTSFTLYANVAGDRTRRRAMLVAMFGIAVLAAAVPATAPGALHEPPAVDRTTVFVVAYLACRMLAGSTWAVTGKVLAAWPAAQAGAGLLPWLVSIWVPAPARYWLWGLGIALDIVASVLQSADPDRMLAGLQRQSERRRARHESAAERGEWRTLTLARLNLPHFGERLGLFVIIVLGEAVIQVVGAAGNPLVDWEWRLGVTAVAGFGLLVGVWWLTLQYGVNGVPQFEAEDQPPAVTLPGHFVATASITAMAAGLGAVAAHAGGHLPTGTRWLLCGGLAVHLTATGVLALLAKVPLHWLLGWGLPCVLAPLALGAFGATFPAWLLAVLVALVVAWQTAYAPIRRRVFA